MGLLIGGPLTALTFEVDDGRLETVGEEGLAVDGKHAPPGKVADDVDLDGLERFTPLVKLLRHGTFNGERQKIFRLRLRGGVGEIVMDSEVRATKNAPSSGGEEATRNRGEGGGGDGFEYFDSGAASVGRLDPNPLVPCWMQTTVRVAEEMCALTMGSWAQIGKSNQRPNLTEV